MTPPDAAEFVERVKRERVERGLSPCIVDDDTLRLIASLAATRKAVRHERAA